jgi:hypothetical protein
MGNVSLGVGALSYVGELGVGVIADRDTFPDLDVFVAAMEHELTLLTTSQARA